MLRRFPPAVQKCALRQTCVSIFHDVHVIGLQQTGIPCLVSYTSRSRVQITMWPSTGWLKHDLKASIFVSSYRGGKKYCRCLRFTEYVHQYKKSSFHVRKDWSTADNLITEALTTHTLVPQFSTGVWSGSPEPELQGQWKLAHLDPCTFWASPPPYHSHFGRPCPAAPAQPALWAPGNTASVETQVRSYSKKAVKFSQVHMRK